MIVAFHGALGRADATVPALAVAMALGADAGGLPVTFARILLPGDPALRLDDRPAGLAVVERDVRSAPAAALAADEEIARAMQSGVHLILDLPASVLDDPVSPGRASLRILAVGPTSLDLSAAAALTKRLDPQAILLLGVGRSGGAVADSRFAERVKSLGEGRFAALPVTMPAMTVGEVDALLAGKPRRRARQAGEALRHAVKQTGSGPRVTPDRGDAGTALPGRAAVRGDGRGIPERLRDLADDLERIGEGTMPDADELAGAPIVERWSSGVRLVTTVVGRGFGHPSVLDGHSLETSEVWATDGATWVRTLSRFLRLGTPAESHPPSALN